MGERRMSRKPRPELGDLCDPLGLGSQALEYLNWMEERNYSALTLRQKEHHLRIFIGWCEERGIGRPSEITKPILERYQGFLHRYRNPRTNRGLSFKTQRSRLVTVQVFFRWLCRTDRLLSNPASDLELPKVARSLPRGVLSISEIEHVLNLADANDVFGLRDRAIMETLYSTGLRRSELVNLTIRDVDREGGTVFVCEGKGKKDRVVPIGPRALLWVDKYLSESRPELTTSLHENKLFLNNLGESLTPGGLSNIIKTYLSKAQISQNGACHLFRHSMATHMLENGADIRYIQQILGHSKLETTQIYTHISIGKLKQVHAATHPAKPHRKPRSADPAEDFSLLAAEPIE